MKILPHQIDVNRQQLEDTFGKAEIETIALLIVRWSLEHDNAWDPFSPQQLKKYADSIDDRIWGNGRWLERLVSGGFVLKTGKKCRVTSKFINRCYSKHPVKIEVEVREDGTRFRHLYVNGKLAGSVHQEIDHPDAMYAGKWLAVIHTADDGLYALGNPYFEDEPTALRAAVSALKLWMNLAQWEEGVVYVGDDKCVVFTNENGFQLVA